MLKHSPPPNWNLAGQSHGMKLSVNLIKKKNLWLAQIKSSSLPEQKIALDHLLLLVRSKIRSLRKAEKSRKRHWLLKKARNDFKHNPYMAGKSLLDPKCFVSLKIYQANLDQHKASSLNHQSYDVPLGELEGLPLQSHVIKMFKKACFSYYDFLNLLSSHRNASAPGLNGIPYKVYKKSSKLSKFLFQILKCAFSKGEIPLQCQSAREAYIPKSVFQVLSWIASPDQNHWQQRSPFFQQPLFGSQN